MSSARRTKLSATRSTPISSPVCTCLRSSSGTEGSAAASPGMLRPWREATAPPTSTSASISPSPGRVAVTRRRTAPSARYMISSLWTLSARPAQVIDIRCASPSKPSAPQTKVRWSPGLSSAIPSASGPIRSLGPGRSWRIATWRPARPGRVAHQLRGLGVLLRRAVREVQPRDVHARLDHAHEDLGIARGGADRGDDLGAAHRTAHGSGCAAWTMLRRCRSRPRRSWRAAAGRHVVAVVLRELRRRVQPGVTTASSTRAGRVFARHGAQSAPKLVYDARPRSSSASTTRPCTACPAAGGARRSSSTRRSRPADAADRRRRRARGVGARGAGRARDRAHHPRAAVACPTRRTQAIRRSCTPGS